MSFKRFRAYMVMYLLMLMVQATVGAGLVFYVFFDICEAVVEGRMSAGDFSVVYAYFLQLVTNVMGLGAMWFNLQNNVSGMRRVFEVADSTVDADRHGDSGVEQPIRHVGVEHAVFRYPDGTEAVRDVSFDGRVGEVVALVGATGAGKSTLAYLVAGFVQPTDGTIRYDGVDGRELRVDVLRSQVAFVFQEPFVFDDTAAANIRMGNPQASDAELARAAKTAGALDFIEALPDGFQTRLGRAGARLSVGQKQRLAIARGLVSPAPILVLDEPTAALDPETENALVEALKAERVAATADRHRPPSQHHPNR